MKIKRFIALLLAIVCVFSLVACGKDVEKDTVDDNTTQTETPEQSYMVARGTVLEIHDNYVLIQPLHGDQSALSADKIEIALKGTITWEDKKVGDVIEVAYEDGIQETYPARIPNVISITLLGDDADIVPNVPQPEIPEPNDPTEKPVDFDFDMTFEFSPCELYNDDCVVFEAVDVVFDETRGLVFTVKVYEINNDRPYTAEMTMNINGNEIENYHVNKTENGLLEFVVSLSELAKFEIKNVETMSITNVTMMTVVDNVVMANFDSELRIVNNGESSIDGIETVMFNNTEYNKKDLSEETLQWLEWYNSLSGDEQLTVDSIPAELTE